MTLSDTALSNQSFSEPWQAELFAVTVQLSRQGLFTWSEWVARLALGTTQETVPVDESDSYYKRWLAALEALLLERAGLSGGEIDSVQEHWRLSYLSTPHGRPVRFSRDVHSTPPADFSHDHSLDAPGRPEVAPVAVHPAVTG